MILVSSVSLALGQPDSCDVNAMLCNTVHNGDLMLGTLESTACIATGSLHNT